MPKHSMHCTPDLVTVLPPAVYFTVWCCGRVVDRLTSNRGSVPLMTCLTCAYSFEDLFVVSYGVHGFPEDNLKTNRIPQKKKKKKRKNSTQQLWKWKWKSKCAVAILLDHFSVCCYDVSCRISRIWLVWLFFFFFFKWWVHVMYNQIYYIYGMFYRRQNMKSAKHTAQKHRLWKCCCIFRLTFYQCKYHLYIFFCIFFVRCFLNSTLIKKRKKKATMILSFKLWVLLEVTTFSQCSNGFLLVSYKCKKYRKTTTLMAHTKTVIIKKIARSVKLVHFYWGLKKYYKAYIIIKHLVHDLFTYLTHSTH